MITMKLEVASLKFLFVDLLFLAVNGHHKQRPKTSNQSSHSKLHTAPQNIDEDSLPQYMYRFLLLIPKFSQ